MNPILKIPTDKEFQQICNFIEEFELDNRGLQKTQFVAAFYNNKLVGFGRLRQHNDCVELCSLGVVTPYRRQGIGKAIVNELIKKPSDHIYLVCVIPNFFIPFGFQIVENFPKSILDKKNYCTTELVVPETYVAICLKK